jgi:EAL domain-containing protein (putative c-di-GMP-specific phosphodiesterase class I)
MYAAKAAGKATSRRFHPDMHQQVQQDLSIRTELRRAVDRNEFILLYQPIVRVDTEEIVGFEALIRWEHPTRGLVSPDDFIPYAEQTGLIVPIGAWVVGEACTTAMVMRQVARREISMSVNVSPRQLQHDDVVDVVRTALMDSGLSADSLCLEITESVLANDIMLIDRLHSLRDLGLHIAIDDFGTGFSSYGHLQRLPIDTIKIDRTFVDRLGVDEATPALARSIIRMSQSLGLRTVAEGVENVGQQAALRELGCPLAQGFLFSSAIPMAAALVLLEERGDAQEPPVG